MFLLPISFNAFWHTIWCPSLLLLFDMDLPQWLSMKSYVILEAYRIEIDQIVKSRFRNGTENISGIKKKNSRKSIKFTLSGRFYRVGRKRETNNILILALSYKKWFSPSVSIFQLYRGRKPLICHKSLTNFITMLYHTPRHEQGLNS